MNKNLTYEDYLLKSVDSTAVELLSDSDLVFEEYYNKNIKK